MLLAVDLGPKPCRWNPAGKARPVVLIAAAVTTGLGGCGRPSDPAVEESAILELLNRESALAVAGDLAGLLDLSVQEPWIAVSGDMAWVVCDNVWRWREGGTAKRFQNLQLTICEKMDGRWKIAFQAFVRDPEHPVAVEER